MLSRVCVRVRESLCWCACCVLLLCACVNGEVCGCSRVCTCVQAATEAALKLNGQDCKGAALNVQPAKRSSVKLHMTQAAARAKAVTKMVPAAMCVSGAAACVCMCVGFHVGV